MLHKEVLLHSVFTYIAMIYSLGDTITSYDVLKDLLMSIQSLGWLISFSSKVAFLDVEFFVAKNIG